MKVMSSERVEGGPHQSRVTADWSTRLTPKSLRGQFTLVIFLLAFLPNFVLTISATPDLPASTTIVWMLLVATACGGIGYFLSGALLASVNRLENEVKAGNFAAAHADDATEIRALRDAFQGLLARLSTEQNRRNAFMATLVHDLKTPLIATGHLTHALTRYPLPDAERQQVGEQIQDETQRLLSLVQQMADAHRFERDDIQLQLKTTDLRAVADEVAQRLKPHATKLGKRLEVEGHGHAAVDRPTLERALTNLSDNALRYAESEVRLIVNDDGLAIQDDGPGLGKPLNELAQPFNAQPTTIAGQQYTAGTAGLGLFIARRIAEAHGGSLEYQRTTPLGSSTPALPTECTLFTIRLPEVTP